MDDELITVNNFYGHWIKDINIRNPDNVRILPTNNTVDVYQYSAQQLKYWPKDTLKTVEKTFLYQKSPLF